ncbi:unnamed protein product [Moneuplotes crassus]|uniref:Uncharacterized protein n=1 Tax=Euplotes crassus TaxID=5936 RepID=A0AAD1X653_EUPCR|nr:unnamed protein product [Moneuplotes crassus]
MRTTDGEEIVPMRDFELGIYKDMISQQQKKLKILDSIKQISNDTESDFNITGDFLDQAVNTIIYKKEEKARKIRERIEIDKINEIKNSIFEKHVLDFEDEIIDFNFIPISVPNQSNKDPVVLIFARNGIDSTTLEIQDLRGEVILEYQIQNCTTKYLLPSLHPQDIFAAVICHNYNFHMIKFSTEEFIDSQKPSENSPFFKIVENSFLNLPEEVSKILVEKNETLGDSFDIIRVAPYFSKRIIYFLMVDNSGRIINLKGSEEIMSVFRLETSQITAIERHNLSILFSTSNNIGFMKVLEQSSDQVFCEIGTANISSIAGDHLKPSGIYAITQEHDDNSTSDHLVAFEIKASKQRSSTEECKIIGKIKLGHHESSSFSLSPLQGFVTVMDQFGELSVFKALNPNDLIEDQVKYVFQPFKERHNNTLSISEVLSRKKEFGIYNKDIRDINSYQGSFVLIRNPQNLSQVSLFEYIRIVEAQTEGFFDFIDMRIVMLIAAAIVYFLWRQCKGFYSKMEPSIEDYVDLGEGGMSKNDAMKNLKFD